MAAEEVNDAWKPDPIRPSENIDPSTDPLRQAIQEGTVNTNMVCSNHPEGYCIVASRCLMHHMCWADGLPIKNNT